MELAWLKYNKDDNSKYILALIVGEEDGHVICIQSQNFTQLEASIITKFARQLDEMTIQDRMSWLKENIKNAYTKGYKRIKKENLIKVRSYNIKQKPQAS